MKKVLLTAVVFAFFACSSDSGSSATVNSSDSTLPLGQWFVNTETDGANSSVSGYVCFTTSGTYIKVFDEIDGSDRYVDFYPGTYTSTADKLRFQYNVRANWEGESTQAPTDLKVLPLENLDDDAADYTVNYQVSGNDLTLSLGGEAALYSKATDLPAYLSNLGCN